MDVARSDAPLLERPRRQVTDGVDLAEELFLYHVHFGWRLFFVLQVVQVVCPPIEHVVKSGVVFFQIEDSRLVIVFQEQIKNFLVP